MCIPTLAAAGKAVELRSYGIFPLLEQWNTQSFGYTGPTSHPLCGLGNELHEATLIYFCLK